MMGDAGCAVLLRMDNGAVFRVFGLTLSSVHRLLYEFHGDRGVMSNLEADQWRTVRVHHPAWNREEGEPFDQTYAADWPHHGDEARASGHGGGDFWMNYHFARAIRSGQQPVLDVYYGASMAAAAVQAWRSCLDEGRPYPVPDFTSEETRRDYEDDRWSPFPEDAGPGQPPPSIRGVVEPSAEAVAFAGEVWHSIGYEGE